MSRLHIFLRRTLGRAPETAGYITVDDIHDPVDYRDLFRLAAHPSPLVFLSPLSPDNQEISLP